MRILLVLRGNYHAGQEEFIQNNSLKDFCLDINELRFLSSRSSRLLNGYESFDFKNDDMLDFILLDFLELRMKKGEFCVVNAYATSLKNFKDLALKYRYNFFVVDFSQTNFQTCLKNNLLYAKKHGIFMPEKILEKTQNALKKIPKKYKILKPEEWKNCLYQMPNLSAYKKIHHIGDIQGCYSVLKKYLKQIKEDEYYIFLGDYINRGIENGKVLKFLLKICQKENVCLLEGNHERHLINWANGESSSSKEFNENTLKDFRKEGLTPKDAKDFYPYLKECLWYEYYEKKIFCSHAGISFLPKDESALSFVPSNDFIFGIEAYEDSLEIAKQFYENTQKDYYQIFGHRNRFNLAIKLYERSFLCEGNVDSGGYLRVVSLEKESFNCVELKNQIYKKK